MVPAKLPPIIMTNDHDNNLSILREELAKPVGSDELIVMNAEIEKMASIVSMMQKLRITSLTIRNCKFEKRDFVDMGKCCTLQEVRLIDCRNEFGFIRSCLKVKTLRLLFIDKDEAIWRRFDISSLPGHLELMVNPLYDQYHLVTLDFHYLSSYIDVISKNPKFSRLTSRTLSAIKVISRLIDRNIAGYKRCRDVIYTLFLIKKYSDNSITRLMDKNILIVIGKLLLLTIGDREWCKPNQVTTIY